MADEKKETGSASDAGQQQAANAGSPNDLIQSKPDPNLGGDKGESGQQTPPAGENASEDAGKKDAGEGAETVPKSEYEELETKLGTQGKELGDYRDFIGQITPVLNVLEKDPTIVQALIDGKIDGKLAKAALDGKVTVQEAETVSDAHKEVKKELGDKKYDQMKPEDITKLVEEKAKELVEEATKGTKKELNQRITDNEDRRDFEKDFEDFAKDTPDLVEYLPGIEKWFEENPDQYNISIAYDAVRGKTLAKKADDQKEIDEAEAAKGVAGNAGGGQSQSATVIDDKSVIDDLIAPRGNANTL